MMQFANDSTAFTRLSTAELRQLLKHDDDRIVYAAASRLGYECEPPFSNMQIGSLVHEIQNERHPAISYALKAYGSLRGLCFNLLSSCPVVSPHPSKLRDDPSLWTEIPDEA